MLKTQVLKHFFLLGLLLPIPKLQAATPISEALLTKRCQELLEIRGQKLQAKLKAQTLVTRNEKLLKELPTYRKKSRKHLEFTLGRLKQEHQILDLKLQTVEEDIVRKGCPGIRS